MATGDDVQGTASVEIVPDTSNFANDLRGQFSGLKGKMGGALAVLGIGAAFKDTITEAIDHANIKATLQAQLGTTDSVAKKYGKIAGDLYATGVTDSFQEAADSIKAIAQAGLVPPDATKKQIKEIASQATDLAKTFGEDTEAISRAASKLLKTGLAKNADEAFDVIAKGFQSGANEAGDLLDTFDEYSTQFRKFGLDGKTALGLINQGLKAGARDADTVADAIKEFSIRITDGSKTTAASFKALGLDSDKLARDFQKGGKTSQAALDLTLDRLRAFPDPVKQSQIAVGLFGTKAEDLGKALFAIDPSQAVSRLGDFEGAAKRVGDTLRSGPVYELQTLGRRLKSGVVDAVGTALPVALTLGKDFVKALIPTDTGLDSAFSNFGKKYQDFFKGLSGEASRKQIVAGPPSLRGPVDVLPKNSAQRAGAQVRSAVLGLGQQLKPLVQFGLDLGKAFKTIVENVPTEVLVGLAAAITAKKVVETITSLAAAFRALAAAETAAWIASNRIALVIGLVAGLTYGIGRLTGTFDSLGGAFSYFGEGFKQIGHGLAVAGIAIKDFFVTLFRQVSRFAEWRAALEEGATKVGEAIVQGIWAGIKGQWKALGDIGRTIKDWTLKALVSGFGIASPAKTTIPIGADIMRGLLQGMLNIARGVGGWLRDHVKSPTIGFFTGVNEWLYKRGASLVSGLLSGAGSVARGVRGWFKDHVKDPTIGAFNGAGDWLASRGRAVINGLWSGMKGPYRDLQRWVSGIAGWIKAHKGPVHLDGQLLIPAGRALMGGLLKGLKFGFGPVGNFVYGTGKSVKDTIGSIFSNLSGGTAGANQRLGKLMMSQRWSAAQWPALRALWQGESGWNERALNRSSGAYGIPQSLPASKMASAGKDWRTNAGTQIKWGLNYIASRYGSPGAAYAAWLRRKPHWYDSGGIANYKGMIPKNTNAPERVLSPRQTAAFERWMDGGGAGSGIGGLTLVLVNEGVISSEREMESWLTTALTNLQRSNRLGTIVKAALKQAGVNV